MNVIPSYINELLFKFSFICLGCYLIFYGVRGIVGRELSLSKEKGCFTIGFSIFMANTLIYVSTGSGTKSLTSLFSLDGVSVPNYILVTIILSIVLFVFYSYFLETNLSKISFFGFEVNSLMSGIKYALEKQGIEFNNTTIEKRSGKLTRSYMKHVVSYNLPQMNANLTVKSFNWFGIGQIVINSENKELVKPFISELLTNLNFYFSRSTKKPKLHIFVLQIVAGILSILVSI